MMLIGSQLGFIAGSAPLVGTITQIGSGLTISGSGFYMCPLSATRIALTYYNGSVRKLATYDWSGSAWSLVGNALTISDFQQGVAFLPATRVAIAYYDNPNNRIRLKAYDFNGTDWAAVGIELTINTSDPNTRLCALGTNQIALLRDVNASTNAGLATYSFDGSNFSIVGSELTISGGAAGNLKSMDKISSTRIVAVSGISGSAAAIYDFNGSTWSAVGSAGAFDDVAAFVKNEDLTTILVSIQSGSTTIQPRKFNGSTFSTFGTALTIASASNPAACGMGNDSFAFIDITNDQLRFYTMT